MEELLKAHQAISDAWYAAYQERVRQHIETVAAKRKLEQEAGRETD